MDSEIQSKARARTRAHIRAAGHYREVNPHKSIAHYKRAMRYSSFGNFTSHVSLRFKGELTDQVSVIRDHQKVWECAAEIVGSYGGVTEEGYREYKRCKDSGILVNIATVVASNSGRPGGACRKRDGTLDTKKVHENHKTQEEDVVSNWMIAETSDLSDDQERQKAMMNVLFKDVSGAFGLLNPGGKDIKTKQHVDYTRGIAVDVNTLEWGDLGPRVYADAWCYEGATLCEKKNETGKGPPKYVTKNKYPSTLVFCSAPNASDPTGREPTSSMSRTYSPHANSDKRYFDAGSAWAVYTALYASAIGGCDTVFLPFVGGGVYAGPHKPDINEFKRTVDTMLSGGFLPDKTPVPALGRCFRRVAIVVIQARTSYGVSGAKKEKTQRDVKSTLKNPKIKKEKREKPTRCKPDDASRWLDETPEGDCAICYDERADLQTIRDDYRGIIRVCADCARLNMNHKVDDLANLFAAML